MPSESESFGLAALEAMACKVPVVSSNAGGLPELNVDGVTGFLRDIGDVDGMAEQAIYILEDEKRLQQFKDSALARAKEFDLAKILPAYEDYYIEVIERTKEKV
jgi:glycosyltransferase involved in cell wall biosynthesis